MENSYKDNVLRRSAENDNGHIYVEVETRGLTDRQEDQVRKLLNAFWAKAEPILAEAGKKAAQDEPAPRGRLMYEKGRPVYEATGQDS